MVHDVQELCEEARANGSRAYLSCNVHTFEL